MSKSNTAFDTFGIFSERMIFGLDIKRNETKLAAFRWHTNIIYLPGIADTLTQLFLLKLRNTQTPKFEIGLKSAESGCWLHCSGYAYRIYRAVDLDAESWTRRGRGERPMHLSTGRLTPEEARPLISPNIWDRPSPFFKRPNPDTSLFVLIDLLLVCARYPSFDNLICCFVPAMFVYHSHGNIFVIFKRNWNRKRYNGLYSSLLLISKSYSRLK